MDTANLIGRFSLTDQQRQVLVDGLDLLDSAIDADVAPYPWEYNPAIFPNGRTDYEAAMRSLLETGDEELDPVDAMARESIQQDLL